MISLLGCYHFTVWPFLFSIPSGSVTFNIYTLSQLPFLVSFGHCCQDGSDGKTWWNFVICLQFLHFHYLEVSRYRKKKEGTWAWKDCCLFCESLHIKHFYKPTISLSKLIKLFSFIIPTGTLFPNVSSDGQTPLPNFQPKFIHRKLIPLCQQCLLA